MGKAKLSDFGWQIYNGSGVLVADNSVIMSRRLGVYFVPPTNNVITINVPVNINGGTPFAHATFAGRIIPPTGAASGYEVPTVLFYGNIMTIKYEARHWGWYYDDSGNNNVYLGNVNIHYGVYNK